MGTKMEISMTFGNRRLYMLISLVALFAVSCLENGGTCTNACRFMLDCRESRINRALEPEEKRVELHDCRLQCRNGFYAGIWTEGYTDCVTASEGRCNVIDACPALAGLPEETWDYVGYDTDYSWEDLLEEDTSCVGVFCDVDHLYCYDSSGNRASVYEYCASGCSGDQCN